MKRTLGLIFLLTALRPVVYGQTGMLTGQVTLDGAVSGQVKVFVVRTNDPSDLTYSAIVDDEGRFAIKSLPAGRYLVSAFALGYALDAMGPNGRIGKYIDVVSDGQAEVQLRLLRGGSLSGRLTYQSGQPVIGQKIKLYRIEGPGRKIYYEQYLSETSNLFETDDRGVFRIWGLPPGIYQLSCGTPENTQSRGYVKTTPYFPETFYPGKTMEKDAKSIELRTGENVSQLDFTLASTEAVFRISGQVRNPHSLPAIGASVMLRNRKAAGSQSPLSVATTNKNGEFTISYVRSGEYDLTVVKDAENLYSEPQAVMIKDNDIEDIKITLLQGGAISGQIISEGTPPVDTQRLLLGMQIVSEDGRISRVEYVTLKDRGFRLGGLPAGKINFIIGNVANASLVRIERSSQKLLLPLTLRAGEDVTGLQLIVSTGDASIMGRLVLDDGKDTPGKGYLIAAMRADNGQMAGTLASTKPDGSFMITGLVPGTYIVGLATVVANQPARLLGTTQITLTIVSGQNPEVILKHKRVD